MPQRDFLIGSVVQVLDGDTFEMKVTRVGRRNRAEYDYEEKIHIKGLKPADFVTLVGRRPRKILENVLRDREIMCLIHGRNPGGQIEADVYII